MTNAESDIQVPVDLTNPGQFFACCGLLELADRLWPGAEGWFGEGDRRFHVACEGTLTDLIETLSQAELVHSKLDDKYSSPIALGGPFGGYCIDWWEYDQTGAKDLKVWAGTMESHGIARALQKAMRDSRFFKSDLFNIGMVVSDADDSKKKKEPYYFDARRAPNAHSRDVGFSPNDLKLSTLAYPAVELLCLIGLQRARPRETDILRIYEYFSWSTPLPCALLLAASSGCLALQANRGYRFENWFRTGQKKHKVFQPAVPLD